MSLKFPIYMDNHATTPLDPRVLEAMLPYFSEHFGNAASRTHAYGWRAEAAVDDARDTIAQLINAESGKEITFTSGATESDNLAIKGVAEYYAAKGNHIITTTIEHKAVLDSCKRLEKQGFTVTYLPAQQNGIVDPEAIRAAMTDKTILVSVMLANNEVGTIQPIAEIAAHVRNQKGVLLHVDAVQAAPYVDLDLRTLDADLVSMSAHKLEGPKGVGVLFVRHGTHILAQQQGGTQERHRRAGTENVAGAVGLATAYELSCSERPETVARLKRQRERIAAPLLAVPGVEITGHPKKRLPGLLSVIARDTDGASVAMSLDLEGIACSVGSACTTGSTEVSHVLTAMGYPEEEARGALRLSLGRGTTDEEVATAAEVVPRVVAS